jgi:exonuclease III
MPLERLFPPSPQLSMMNIITWNIIGLNGRPKQRILRNYVKLEDPDILLLQQTKCAGNMEEEAFKICWQDCKFPYTKSKGVVGGISILWNPTKIILEPTFSTLGTLTSKYIAIGSSK